MRRDMGLIRELLLKLEAYEKPIGSYADLRQDNESMAVPGFTEEQIGYHLVQIDQSGFIDNNNKRLLNGIYFRCLTPKGHDFLDSIRDPDIWSKTKKGAEKVGNASIEFIWEIAKGYGKHLIKKKLGLDI
jgi:hypothetical protein